MAGSDWGIAERVRILRGTALFSGLPEPSLLLLAEAAKPIDAKAGTMIVRQREPGDGLYVVARGAAQVFTLQSAGNEVVLARIGEGEVFGEQYLFEEGALRSASVRAHEDTELLFIATPAYRAMLERNPELGRQIRARGRALEEDRSVRLSELARALQLESPCQVCTKLRFAAGDVVFREGDAADAFYVILSGKAVVHREQTPGTPLQTLQAGQGFGELALINDAPRAASVRAETDLFVESVGRDRFLQLHEQSEELRDYVAALSLIYRLPNRGVAFQWVARRAGEESVERTYRMEDGRTFASSFLLKSRVFRMEATGDAAAGVEHRWDEGESGRSRSIHLDEKGRIVRLLGAGMWGQLPSLIEAALDGKALEARRLSTFAATGAVFFDVDAKPAAADPKEIICFCVQVDRGTICKNIEAGCRTFDALRKKTGCGSICGGCEPKVKELLGHSEWIPVTAKALPILDTVRSFRFYPQSGAWAPGRPGQHIVVEGFVDGVWVARNYTITSPPEETKYVEISVKREPKGLFSRWLFDGEPDAKALRVSPARGDVHWTAGQRATICFVAGIGVTPALAIVRALQAGGGGARGRVHVDYSGRTAQELAFSDELKLAASQGRITLRLRVTETDGRISESEIASLVREHPDADFHICGPDPYMKSVEAALADSGVPADRIKAEVFFHAGAPQGTPAQKKPQSNATWDRFRRAGYRAGIGAAATLALALLLPFSLSFRSPGPLNTGHGALGCENCHAVAPGTARQQLQANTAWLLGRRKEPAPFAHLAPDNKACLDCHARADDAHPAFRFLEPRFSAIRKALAPEQCASCHKEHNGARVTQSDIGFCAGCHETLRLQHDPLDVPHAALIEKKAWSSCLGCHDYHGNHTRKPQQRLAEAFGVDRIRAYFDGDASPYGDALKQKAKKGVSR